jgi:hypothetical protein
VVKVMVKYVLWGKDYDVMEGILAVFDLPYMQIM